ncbi:MAG: hypothetical protein NTV46_02590 [Verrucomicrobia bacterium]|nr:hypothetical protein [Verrucomicrobiota bacterium]
MDFATRDRYRHVVEAVARHSRLTEAEVAQMTVQLAADAARRMGRADRSAHVGFYLIDRGLKMLERRAEVRWSLPTRVERAIQRFPLAFYVGGIALVTLLVTCGFVHLALALGTQGRMLVLLSLVFVPGASQLAVALLNWLSTLLVKPCLLPRLDYSSGIAPDCRTMVVVPTMLTHAEGIDRLIESLEIHYLANRDEHLHFALLTDYRDADAEHLPGDQELLRRVQTGVEMLNRPVSSPAALERRRGPVDGLRAQAGKTHGIQRPSPRRFPPGVFHVRRGDGRFAGHQVRHHARHRHPVAARCRPAARRHHGPSVEPSGVR